MEPDQLDRIYREVIGPEVFAPYDPATSRPLLILLGGQPGAGKTAAASWLISRHPDHDIVPVIGDDFRRHHPDYHSILANDPLAMPSITAPAAGRWTHLAVQQALGEGYSLLIEGTWRTSDVPLTTLHQASQQGYQVHAAVVAVPPLLSRLGGLSRFYDAQARHEPARWTPHEAHDNAVAHLPDSVQAIAGSPEIDRFTILTREATTLLDQKAPVDAIAARRALTTHWRSLPTPEQAARIVTEAVRLYALHHQITADQPEAQQTWTVMMDDLAALAAGLEQPARGRHI